MESHGECHRRHPKKRGERRDAKGRVERVGDLRARGISERAHSFRNTGARPSSSWKTLLCPPGMGPQHELQRFLVLLPSYLYCPPPIPLRAAVDKGGRPRKDFTLGMANHVVRPGRERPHRRGQGGGIWVVGGQGVLQRRGPDWLRVRLRDAQMRTVVSDGPPAGTWRALWMLDPGQREGLWTRRQSQHGMVG